MTEQPPDNHGPAIPAEEYQNDGDSGFEGSVGAVTDTTSLRSSIKNYVYENGRRYHSYREGEYILPNDEDEQDRMDLSHHIYRLILGGELYRAPIVNPQRVLDLGTGTGSWAIDFADQHPEALVIGIDLSPIQPSWVPPNCKFEVDDYEQDWVFQQKFDFIHGRELEGCIRDHDKLFAQCFANLRPGGYLEMQSIEVATHSDDGSLERAKEFQRYIRLVHEAAQSFDKRMDTVPTWKEKLQKAGFTDVTVEKYKSPHTEFPDDPKLKELSLYTHANAMECLAPYSYALFSRVLKWELVEVEVFLANVRRELQDKSLRLYADAYFIHGKKPNDS